MLDNELDNKEREDDEPGRSGGSATSQHEQAPPGAQPVDAARYQDIGAGTAPPGPAAAPGGQPPVSGPAAIPPVPAATFQPPQVVFQPPAAAPVRSDDADDTGVAESGPDGDGAGRRRRRRGGRGRGKGGDGASGAAETGTDRGTGAATRAGDAGGESGAPGGPGSGGAEGPGDDSTGERSPRSRRRGHRGSPAARDGDEAAGETGKSAAAGAGQAAGADAGAAGAGETDQAGAADAAGGPVEEDEVQGARRRRRRRRRSGVADGEQTGPDDPPNTVVHVREPRTATTPEWAEEVQSVKGSTRLEAKKQRRREGRDSGRRRPPLLSESEFLARREAVHRAMLVRQRAERTQIAVLEDGVLVEHYVDRATGQSMAGNIYLGKVQNVLPSMEAAFVDIGKGRNAVLYAGEINFDASGLEGQPKRIETVLKSGQSVLVQVTKDPVGHKGARLTNQVSLPGRYLVYVPGASMTGISRKLPAPERTRLKQILKKVTPEDAGVIVRTAAEGTGEEELARDVARLAAQWENIERKAQSATPPELLYSEPDLTIRVVRDIFNEDFSELVVAGDDGWDMVNEYVRYVAPHLAERVRQWRDDNDLFAAYRVDEQIAKALERKVWLPSGGSLVIDRTEAMTVIDVNTGKFTGQGGNLEETVTRNNLEAAEEIVRQLRLRDIGGIIVIDFIDMVLESNRELVLRRLLECLARDRTKHQVAEVTSLGLVQMTRKRVGSGLLEAFSEPCECCNGRGLHVSVELLEATAGKRASSGRGGGKANGKGRGRGGGGPEGKSGAADAAPAADAGQGGRGGAATDGDAGNGAAPGGADGEAPPARTGDKAPGRRRRRKPAAAGSDHGARSTGAGDSSGADVTSGSAQAGSAGGDSARTGGPAGAAASSAGSGSAEPGAGASLTA